MTNLLAILGILAVASTASADYLAYKPDPAATRAWTVANWGCKDGNSVPALSSLPAGEIRTGTLESKDFDCPAKLSFGLAGHSNQKKNFVKLVDAASGEAIKSETPPGINELQPVEWDLSAFVGKRVRLELVDEDNGTGWAWMAFGKLFPEVVTMPKSSGEPMPSDWVEAVRPPTETSAQGIPFIEGEMWQPVKEGESLSLDMAGVRAKSVFILGCTNSVDEAVPGWGGSNDSTCFFIGDKAGSITIAYKHGVTDTIPLIFGYNIWWRTPYNRSPEPFKSDPKAKAMLDKALCVANGLEGGDAPYFIKISLRDIAVGSITVNDNPNKIGTMSVRGITFEGVTYGAQLNSARFAIVKGGEVPAQTTKWIESHTISSADAYPAARREAIADIGRLLSTRAEDISFKSIAAVKPEFTAKNYPGPKVTFSGPPEAAILTNVYYENSNELLGRIDDDGRCHESGLKADNYGGFGGFTPGLQAFYTSAYTRLRALTLLGNAGFSDKADKSILFFDKWMMYFPQSFPKIQLGGKPIPGHTTVIANEPHIYFDVLRTCGWPTKYKTRDFGNPETDGHGLLMLTRWRAWVKGGRTKNWVDSHWEALNEAAEFIPWALDNPDLSFSEHGLLYAESEGGMMNESLYCNVCCYYGMLGYVEMAEAAGKLDKAKRWREQAERLLKAMNAYFPAKDDKYGDIWDLNKTGGWGPATALAPIVIGTDLYGCDAISALPEGWAERTRRTYARQITQTKPQWCAPAGMGYNQCYFAESSLLLDQMSDANNFVSWMARFCFAPNLPHPYRVPEGAAIAEDGSVWRRWGDLGNLYQLAEVVYTTHLMIGIDDLDASHVKLMPRLPADWTGLKVEKWPVRAKSDGKSALVPMSMGLKIIKGALSCDVTSEQPIDSWRMRLGPFAADAQSLSVEINGKPAPAQLVQQGDSKWAWVSFGDGKATKFSIKAEATK